MAKNHTASSTTPAPTVSSEIPDVYRLVADWRSTLREFMSASKEILKKHEVTSMQYQTLLAIRVSDEPEGLSMNGLAGYLGVRHNSAVGLINRLEAHGLVLRARSQRDRRVAHLRLTEEGENALEVLAEAHGQELNRIRPEMRRIFK
ncbi:MAG TPA: MarR family transcriptional regulator [Gammaproteobacteria bacterium]